MLIDTPRRLHLGIIDPSGSLGRRFGSLGAGIEGGYLVRIEESEGTEIIAERGGHRGCAGKDGQKTFDGL